MEEEKLKLLRAIAAGGISSGGGSLGAIYQPVAPSLASGASTSLYTDVKGNLLTSSTLNSLIAGEDLTNNKLVVEHKYTPFNLTQSATISIIKSSSGLVHNLNIGQLSNPTITLYDNASGASGTVLAHVQPLGLGAQDSYLVDLSFTNGLTAYMTAGNATIITGGYR